MNYLGGTMAAQFQFVMHSGPNTGKIYPLEASEIIIGRDASNLIAINDAEVSRKHAKLIQQNSTYVIQDLGSTNGTFINGQRITTLQELKPGDTVTLGENIVLMYETSFDPNATVISSAQSLKTVAPVQKPVPTPAPAQAQVPAPVKPPSTAPVEVFTGQAPTGQVSKTATPGKKKFPFWLIILIILIVIVCACVGFFLIIDQFGLWCKVMPWLVPLIGGTCA
jgi:pSer/pThr/pTyr-binding forkhead associated (FHA) protein